MNRPILVVTLVGFAMACQSLTAQDISGAVQEHHWLKKFVGEWDVESEGTLGEGQPTIKAKGVMKSTMLGDLWLVNSSDSDVAGTPMKSIQMIGYDSDKKKYVGTWADSLVNYLWQYEGSVDQSGKKLTLNADGPNYLGGGGMTKYRDAYEFKDDHTIIATSSMLGEDGKWMIIMKGTAKRRMKK